MCPLGHPHLQQRFQGPTHPNPECPPHPPEEAVSSELCDYPTSLGVSVLFPHPEREGTDGPTLLFLWWGIKGVDDGKHSVLSTEYTALNRFCLLPLLQVLLWILEAKVGRVPFIPKHRMWWSSDDLSLLR